jgi:ribosomal-protein-alanine N-acetyltransferase
MKLVTLPMTAATAEVAAALHGTAGLPESWDAKAFCDLLAISGTEGCFALDAGVTGAETGDPVGLALWRVVLDEAELLTICVPPDRRRRGAGRFLLEAALGRAAARGARRMFLEVAVDNAPATALYRAFGFGPHGRRRGYYRTESGPVDAEILMLDGLEAGWNSSIEPLSGRT